MSDLPAAVDRAEPRLDTARLRTQVAREEWEETWVAQQRDATAVVMSDTQSKERAAAAPVVFGDPKGSEYNPTANPPPDQGGQKLQALAGRADGSALAQQIELTHRATKTAAGELRDGVGVSRQRTPIGLAGVQSAAAQAPISSATRLRENARHFALWREGTAVEIAMRLKSTAEAPAIVDQLRQWLRAGGAFLRKVVLNGTMAYQEGSSEHTAPERPDSKLNRYI